MRPGRREHLRATCRHMAALSSQECLLERIREAVLHLQSRPIQWDQPLCLGPYRLATAPVACGPHAPVQSVQGRVMGFPSRSPSRPHFWTVSTILGGPRARWPPSG